MDRNAKSWQNVWSPTSVGPEFINSVYVADEETRASVSGKISSPSISVIPPKMFFQPNSRNKIGDNISVQHTDVDN